MAERLTIVGAGPVGSLLALTLARRGYEVDVFERRPDMRRTELSAGRSINLAVSTRGLHALHAVGLDDAVLEQAVPMLGRTMHALDGAKTFLRYGKDDSQFINSMSRGELNKLLMTEAEKTGRVRIRFEQRLVGYDFAARRASFRDERTGQVAQVDAKVIIGTDGSASALRAALPETRVAQDVLSSGYKELTLPPLAGGGFALEPNALHIWPRGSFMLIALPNRDGSFTCTLFLAFEGSGGSGTGPGFSELRTPDEVRRFFETYFADAAPLIPNLAEQFLAAPTGQMATIKAWPWAHGSALLLGDAAHAIVPFFGQGMNAGFEDVTVLDALLRDDFAAAFAELAAARKPDTDAIADLAVENFAEMRDKVADKTFLLHKAVEAQLQQRFPGQYASRYQLVTFSRVPYRIALQAGLLQSAILDELCPPGVTKADQVDYRKAGELLATRLVPFLEPYLR